MFRIACLAALVAIFTGCGLVAYPNRVQLPAAHYQMVSVRDAVSGLPLTNAVIRFEGRYFKNWARLVPPITACPALNPTNLMAPRLVLVARQRTPGDYAFEPVRRYEWSQVLFPFGLPLGGVMHHYYDHSIIAQCPGYRAVFVHGAPSIYPQTNSNRALALVEYSGQVTVFMPRATP
jgi:hypothetical protein